MLYVSERERERERERVLSDPPVLLLFLHRCTPLFLCHCCVAISYPRIPEKTEEEEERARANHKNESESKRADEGEKRKESGNGITVCVSQSTLCVCVLPHKSDGFGEFTLLSLLAVVPDSSLLLFCCFPPVSSPIFPALCRHKRRAEIRDLAFLPPEKAYAVTSVRREPSVSACVSTPDQKRRSQLIITASSSWGSFFLSFPRASSPSSPSCSLSLVCSCRRRKKREADQT